MPQRGKDRLGAARLPRPPVQHERRGRTIHAHTVRQRELRPFLDERGIGVSEQPEQRGHRGPRRGRPVVAGRIRQASRMHPRPPSRTRLHPEPRGIGQERVGRALAATGSIGADRHGRAERAKPFLWG